MKRSSSTKAKEKDSLAFSQFMSLINQIIKLFPGNVYWKNSDGVYLGANEAMLKLANVTKIKGKTDFDLPWKEAPRRYGKPTKKSSIQKKQSNLKSRSP